MSTRVTDHDFAECHEMFGRDHERLRCELVTRLEHGPSPAQLNNMSAGTVRHVRLSRAPALTWALAAAAAIALVLGAATTFFPIAKVVTPNAAWASAIQQAGQVRSVHFVTSTPGRGGGSSVEFWWRRPHEFRMEFPNGPTIASDGVTHATLKDGSKTLTLRDFEGPGLEMFILGALGEPFTSDYSVTKGWIEESRATAAEDIMYKGEPCRKITVERDDQRYEYIVDRNSTVIYEGTHYSRSDPSHVLQHMVVLGIDEQLPDSLFTIEPTASTTVEDHRSER